MQSLSSARKTKQNQTPSYWFAYWLLVLSCSELTGYDAYTLLNWYSTWRVPHTSFLQQITIQITWILYENVGKCSICRFMHVLNTLNSVCRVKYLNEIESPQNANTLRFFYTHTLLKINADLKKFLCTFGKCWKRCQIIYIIDIHTTYFI